MDKRRKFFERANYNGDFVHGEMKGQGRLTYEYEVAVGTLEDQTPIGRFAVIFKEVNPTWVPGSKVSNKTPVPPGPKNPLGKLWIEFLPANGIHGTDKMWTVEYPISRGCVRM